MLSFLARRGWVRISPCDAEPQMCHTRGLYQPRQFQFNVNRAYVLTTFPMRTPLSDMELSDASSEVGRDPGRVGANARAF